MDEELKTAIDRLNTLLKERNSPEWWSDNIIDASKDLKKKKNWTKFYAYMTNPANFDPRVDLKTISDCDEKANLYSPYEREAIEYKNVNDTLIHVRKKHQPDSSSPEIDEKSPD